MKEKTVKGIIVAIIIIILAIPIVIEMVSNSALKTVTYDDVSSTISNTSNYGFTLLYVDDSSSSNVNDMKKSIKDMINTYEENSTNTSVEAYYLDSSEMSYAEVVDVIGSYNKTGYVFISNGEIIKRVDSSISEDELSALLSEYTMNGISEDLTYYKVAENAASFKKAVNRKNTVTMAVFGRDNCFYCNQFKAVYNTVAEEYELEDIYYFNSLSYDATEYEKIMNMGLKIPTACTDGDKEALLSDGFDTPLTLFTKNGKVIDCIGGYVNKSTLVTKLQTVGMIKIEEEE